MPSGAMAALSLRSWWGWASSPSEVSKPTSTIGIQNDIMNPIYTAAFLSPALTPLIHQGVSTWFENPQLAPPGLFKMGVIGQLYKQIVVFISLAAWFSLLGLLFTGNFSFMYAIGAFIFGFIVGALFLSLHRNVGFFNLLIENLEMPGVLAASLFIVHWNAWSAQ